MTLAAITSHTFDRHKKAVDNIGKALHLLDHELKGIARNAQLHTGDQARQEKAARSKAEQTVEAARAALEQALTDDRKAGRYEDVPAGEDLQRRAYWQQQARADLEGMRADEAITVVRRAVDSGDLEKAREYVRVARPIVGASTYAAELKRAEMDAMAPEQRAHQVFAAGVEAVQGNLSWLDRWTGELTAKAGLLSESQRLGWEDEPEPLDTRQLWLWFDRVQQEAGVAGERQAAALDRREPAEWARPGGQEPAVAPAAAGEASEGAAGAGEAS